MKKMLFFAVLPLAIFTSCSSGSKKLIIYTNNNAVLDEAAMTITQKDTSGHNDKTVEYPGAGKIQLTLKLSGGEQAIDIDAAGYYVVNVKAKDTIIGGYQKYAAAGEANKMMSQEKLAHNIDSLKQLITGAGANAANKTYFIPPYTAVKISDNTDAFVVGPYHRMTTIAKTGDKDPEVYRFYSIRELRETIGKLEKLTGAKPGEEILEKP